MTITGIDEYDLRPRLSAAARRWSAGCEVLAIEAMHGSSSLTFQASLRVGEAVRQVVAKVAPPGVPPTRNRDVLRQAALLRVLGEHPTVRAPQVLFEAPGLSLEEPPFFVMEFIAGECLEPILDPDAEPLPAPDIVRGRALSATRTLAALHSVAFEADVLRAEPPVGPADEVERWARSLATVDAELRPYADQVADRLRRTVPAPVRPRLIHGDFRLGNTLAVGPDVVAVLDWEIWSVGDPRVDLLWFLLFTDPGRLPVALRRAPGMPSITELTEEYAAAAGCGPLTDLEWFDALIQFKQAAVTALIVKHNRRRPVPDPQLERSAQQIEPLMKRALSILA